MSSLSKITVGVIGASGYTGAELIRLLANHPRAHIGVLAANTHADQPLSQVFPHLAALDLAPMVKTAEADWTGVDAIFCGLPHGTAQEIISDLPKDVKVIDLSADFRFRDMQTYAEWYGHAHRAPELQGEAIYGLTEHYRDRIKSARLIACPGCYPTAALLALLPLFDAGSVEPEDIIIDAKSGTSGAGRSLKQEQLFCEVAEGIHPYNIAHHRHAPEIEQELSAIAGRDILVNFTPHLMPMNRGELLTIYARLAPGVTAESARDVLTQRYDDEPFVRVAAPGDIPATRHVRGSNFCLIGVFADRLPGRLIVVSVIDNLVKGASGQAIQNFNLMFDLPETLGLEQQPLFP